MVIFKSQEELDAALAKWQKILRLQDWNVSATIERQRDIPLEGRQGYNYIFFPTKTATIMLLDPVDYKSSQGTPQDHENCLVHELLHLHMEPVLSGLQERECRHIEEEQCIEFVAEALLLLDRKPTEA